MESTPLGTMPATLLLADDSVTIQRVIELTFANEDVRVVAVSDGQSAIQRIEAERPDIVLADVGMPKLDGYGVALHIKQSPALRHIPVLLLTGAFEPVDEDRARATGCDGILVKPFDPQQLIGRVKELLAGRRSSGLWPAELPRVAVTTPRPSTPPPAPAPVPPPGPIPVAHAFGIRTPEPPPQSLSAQAPRFPQPAGAHESAFEMEFDQLDAAFAQLDPRAAPATFGAETASDFARDLDALRTTIGRQESGAVSRMFGDWDIPDDEALAGQHNDVADNLSLDEPPASTSDAGSARDVALNTVNPIADAWELRLEPDRAVSDAVKSGGLPQVERPELATQPPANKQVFAATEVRQPNAPAISEAMVEELVRRVLSRMTEDAVRRLVVDTAERVIRQEIERIKTNPH